MTQVQEEPPVIPLVGIPERPALRHVEVVPSDDGEAFLLFDPSGAAAGPVPLTRPGLMLAGCLTGQLTLAEVRAEFLRRHGIGVPEEVLVDLVTTLDRARLLEGGRFLAHYRGLPARPPLRLLQHDDADHNRELLDGVLASRRPAEVAGRVVGLVAPHLDYPRGRPCYAESYGLLRSRMAAAAPRRFVILGTNHFGRSRHVTATDKDFDTPLGRAVTDRAFLSRLADRLGADLCDGDADHLREHSVELQVRFLQHLLGGADAAYVPVLCPDPCGPTGVRPADGVGPDLDAFSDALRELIAEDPVETVVVAGADLAHVGQEFGDEELLDDGRLGEVRRQDAELLAAIAAGRPADMVEHLRTDDNARRVCSAGCLYVLTRTAVGAGAEPRLLGYHQAVNHDTQTAVTCAAAAFLAPA
jgi:AmmeMemoRadiSam system protein B